MVRLERSIGAELQGRRQIRCPLVALIGIAHVRSLIEAVVDPRRTTIKNFGLRPTTASPGVCNGVARVVASAVGSRRQRSHL